MRVLLPDLPEFRALDVPGVTFTYFDRAAPVEGPLDGAVIWAMPRDARRALLQRPGLTWALTLTAGVDGLLPDLPPGLRFYNAHRLHDAAVAEHVAASILTVARGFHRARDAQREGHWSRLDDLWTLEGREVVVWGFGHIGRILEGLLKPFGARVTGIRSSTPDAERDALLGRADVVVLLLPLTDATRGVVSADTLARFKRGAWLVNDGRGPLVDTNALLAALQGGQLAGAVLDVTDPEPLPQGHPLWAMENVLITPHVGSSTADLPERGAAYTRQFLTDLAAGREPEGRVDPSKGY